MTDFEYTVYIVLIGLYFSTQMTLDSVMSSVLCHWPLPAVIDFIDRFLPVKKHFFLTTVAKCLLMG